MDLKQRTDHLAHLYQLHRLHKATCWKKVTDASDKAMGMPKRPWNRPTQMIVVKRDTEHDPQILKAHMLDNLVGDRTRLNASAGPRMGSSG